MRPGKFTFNLEINPHRNVYSDRILYDDDAASGYYKSSKKKRLSFSTYPTPKIYGFSGKGAEIVSV